MSIHDEPVTERRRRRAAGRSAPAVGARRPEAPDAASAVLVPAPPADALQGVD